MAGVSPDVGAVQLAHRAFVGLCRVGGSHDFAPFGYCVFALQGQQDHRTFGHEGDQFVEEAFALVDGVEALRLGERQVLAAQGQDFDAALSMRAMILPVLPAATASGLMMANMRSCLRELEIEGVLDAGRGLYQM